MKTSLKIMNAIIFASLLVQPYHATGSTMGDVMSTLEPAMKSLGGSAMKAQQANAAQDNASADSQKQGFQNQIADKQAEAQMKQQQAASTVKGFPMLDPHSAYLSEGYKNQRNAMFQRSMNKAAADYERTNKTTQAALAAEEEMNQEAMGAVSGVVGKLADQMNKSDTEAGKLEENEMISICAKEPSKCTPDDKGNFKLKVNGKTRTFEMTDELRQAIEKREEETLGAEKKLADMKGNGLSVNGSVWSYPIDGATSILTLQEGKLSEEEIKNIKFYCKPEMSTNRAKQCHDLITKTKKRLGVQGKADEDQAEADKIADEKAQKPSKDMLAIKAEIEKTEKCSDISLWQSSYNTYSTGNYLTTIHKPAYRAMIKAYTDSAKVKECKNAAINRQIASNRTKLEDTDLTPKQKSEILDTIARLEGQLWD